MDGFFRIIEDKKFPTRALWFVDGLKQRNKRTKMMSLNKPQEYEIPKHLLGAIGDPTRVVLNDDSINKINDICNNSISLIKAINKRKDENNKENKD